MRKPLLVFGAITTVLLGLVLVVVALLAPIASGYSAKYLCSQLFVSGRPDAKQVIREEIDPTHPMFSLVSNRVDGQAKTVRSTTLGIFSPTTAVFREGFGCTLAVGKTPDELRRQGEGFRRARAVGKTDEWPRGQRATVAEAVAERMRTIGGNETAAPMTPEGIPVDAARLKQALDRAFSEPATGRRQSQAVAIVYRGRLIAERYAPGFNARTPVLGWSMSKTVTASLAGIMVHDGRLSIHKPAPIPEWKGDPARSKITVNDLLHMSSGLAFTEDYAPFKDAPEMLYGHGDMAHYAAQKPPAHAPGTVWYYSSGDTNMVARIVRQLSGGTAVSLQTFSRIRLFEPLHMETAIIEPDASGTFVGSSYMYASARDWARMGLLLARDGVWEGKRILPPGWVTYMRKEFPDSHGQYGAQTWLNAGRDNPKAPAKRRFLKLAKETFYMSGYNGQHVFILPKEDLIVVRLGVTHSSENWKIHDFVFEVLQSVGK